MKITKTKIRLRDMHFYAYHGVLPQESAVGGYYMVSVSMHLRTTAASMLADDLSLTVSYAEAYALVGEVMARPCKLIECVAASIADALLFRFTMLHKVRVSVRKDTPPMGGRTGGAEVSIVAKREQHDGNQALAQQSQ